MPEPYGAGKLNDRFPLWTTGRADVDLAAPQFYTGSEYFTVWAAARRAHPVAWTESDRVGEFWSVTSHEFGNQVLRQPGQFTSTLGMRIGGNPAAVKRASGKMLVVTDGDAHRRLRQIHSSWFTNRTIHELRLALEQDIAQRLHALIEQDCPVDIVQELTNWFPKRALCRIMGLPRTDWHELGRLTDAAFDDSDESTAAAAARTAAHADIFMYFTDLLEQRRIQPSNDLITALAHATIAGKPLTDEEIILNCNGLMNGGLETTPHAASGAILAFAQNPDSWRRLQTKPDLIDTAVEEILRWTAPAMQTMRTAADNIPLGTAQIRKGDRVVVWIPSCNRDELIFSEGDRFMIDRQPNPHLSFGGGPHYCVGAMLARLELRCLLAVMSRTIRSFEVAGTVSRRRSNFLHGLGRLDITITPEPSLADPHTTGS